MTLKEKLQHDAEKQRELLVHIDALMQTVSGKIFVKHLLDNFGVLELPYEFCKGEELIERLAYHRAGLAVFKLISQSNPAMAGAIIGELQKERNDENNHDGSQPTNESSDG